MKILVLAPQWPDPPRQGAAIRNLHILLYLAQRHDITLLTFTGTGAPLDTTRLGPVIRHEIFPLPARSRLDRLGTLLRTNEPDMAHRLRSRPMHDRVKELALSGSYNAVHVEGIEMAPYGLLALENGVPSMTYDAHNAEYLLQRRAFTTDLRHAARFPKAIYSLVQWWRLRRMERALLGLSCHTLAVSEADIKALARLEPNSSERLTLLPNGVDTEEWSLSASYGRAEMPTDSVVFDGSMDFRPNVDAALWFAARVWPYVVEERTAARFFIVGRHPTPSVQTLGKLSGITVTGAVEDPRPWVAGAAVYVVPMRMGGGVRLKLLQAMSMQRAIVSTPMGAEGVPVEHGQHVLIARSPQGFARSVLDLLSERARRDSLGLAARELVASRYAWPILLPTLDRIYPV